VVALTTRALVSASLTAIVLAGIALAAWLAFTREGLLLDPLTPGLALLITFLVGSVVRHMNSEREQRWVRDAFSRYVSPNRVEHLVNNPGQLELGGRRQTCSFVFTDLEDFTGLMEKMDPGDAVALLNAYLDRMVAIAFASGGTLDRIVGDAVAIMFSAPVAQPDHQARAYQCALDMHAFASQYSADLAARGIAFGKTRIGVHTGEVIVGNFGGTTMFDYRALGDPVNTAARLEGANKYLGTTVCVSEATLAGVANALTRPIGRLVVKGKTQALVVHEPLAAVQPSTTVRDSTYDAAFELLRQGSPQALAAFEQLARERPGDTLVAFHLARLTAGATDDQIRLDEK
jgi:adenylate cyclase